MRWFPILLTVLVLAAGILVCGFIYIKFSGGETVVTSTAAIPTPVPKPKPEINPIEMNNLAVFGGLNLLEVTLADVKNWSEKSGVATVSAYTGPLPDIPPELATMAGKIVFERPKTATVLAGRYQKTIANNSVAISQGKINQTVTFTPQAKIFVNKGGKIFQYGLVNNLSSAPQYFPELFNPYTWLVALGITTDNHYFSSSGLLIFEN